jgi:hypothetical protein
MTLPLALGEMDDEREGDAETEGDRVADTEPEGDSDGRALAVAETPGDAELCALAAAAALALSRPVAVPDAAGERVVDPEADALRDTLELPDAVAHDVAASVARADDDGEWLVLAVAPPVTLALVEVVVLGAHLDSWDLGGGALDNGANVALLIDIGTNGEVVLGSKEWMVRRTSTGLAGSKIGVPISACSQGPRWPRASRGEPFQMVATTA